MIDKNECMPWWGGYSSNGYGQKYLPGTYNKYKSAHRYIWEEMFGEIPEGMCVLHKCDNPACVYPEHLFLGSHKDNAQDRESKGRGNRPVGEKHKNSRLNRTLVKEIRKWLKKGEGYTRAARRYGIGRSTVRAIREGRTWRTVT